MNAAGRKQQFKLDKIFAMDATQAEIFETIIPMIQSAIDGYNICLFAHGQTGKYQNMLIDCEKKNLKFFYLIKNIM